MDKLFGNLKGYFHMDKAVIDSVIFRLHYRFTLVVLLAFSILVTGKQYVGDPIDCISRDDIPTELLDTYCWIHTTFSVESGWFKKVGEQVPYPGVDKFADGEKRVYHAYYQWVCFVLFLQGICFYIPRYIWKNVEGRRIQNLTMDFHNPIISAETDEKTDLLVDYLYENKKNHRVYAVFYIFAELLNFINVVGQIYLTDVFLGGEFTTYGVKVAEFTEWDWSVRYDPMIRVFPRMTKCTFHRFGSSGDVQKHDALCLLPINIVNEKIFVFIWFWFVILAILTGLELLYRILVSCNRKLRYYYLHSRCLSFERHRLEKILDIGDRDDWLILSLLCKNMDSCNFKAVLNRYFERIQTEEGKTLIVGGSKAVKVQQYEKKGSDV